MSGILEKLKGGDLRSIGRAEEVVQDILNNPVLFTEVFEGMLDDDPLVRMRSADALEKVSSSHPEYLQPFKNRLISEVSQVRQQEVRWHVAQMFSYLEVYVVSESGTKWVFEVTNTLDATTLLPSDSIIVLSFC